MKETDKYHFFWDGVFSQWYPSKFKENGIEFNCAEQYMMYHKALVFEDSNTVSSILMTKNPRAQKSLGRSIKNFSDEVWDKHKIEVVTQGNWLKFSRNPEYAKFLLDTGDLTIVEASPYDKIWGIGLAEDDPRALDESQWKGQNLLGKCIMTVRDRLRKHL